MLLQLTVKNFALVEELRIDFEKGLNVLTGETGAGKSILIDALRSVLGERVSTAVLRDKTKPCLIEGVFSVPAFFTPREEFKDLIPEGDDYLVLRREISPDGKGRNYVNRQLVNLSLLKDMGRYLVDFHGQYDQQTIFETETHRELIDRLAGLSAGGERAEALENYRQLYRQYKDLETRKHELAAAAEDKQRQTDLLKYQIDEIEQVSPEEGEEEKLETERIRLSHSRRLFEITAGILKLLDEEDAASSRISESCRLFQQWSRIDESAAGFEGELEDVQIRLEELIRSVRDYQSGLSFDEDRLMEIQDRLDAIENLTRKYGKTITDVKAFLEGARRKYDELVNAKLYQHDLEKQLAKILPDMDKAAQALSRLRRDASKKLKDAVEGELQSLGIPKAVFEARLIATEWTEDGRERVEFFLNPNPGQEIRPLVKIASGGEASRILLALKRALAEVDQTPTLIFDEIDANIGGRLGEVVGRKLREIAGERQILLITHLPQIASFAERHYKVSKAVRKGSTHVSYALLEGEDRIKELAQMMSGRRETEISRSHAEEMLRTAAR